MASPYREVVLKDMPMHLEGGFISLDALVKPNPSTPLRTDSSKNCEGGATSIGCFKECANPPENQKW
jgi:hypothetical protein